MSDNVIKSFTELIVWKESHKLMLEIYKIVKDFPREEIYGLSDQLRRASLSVTSNIAEGFGRFYFKEKIRFYYHAHGSLYEILNQLIASRDLGYFDELEFKNLEEQVTVSLKLLKGLIKSTKEKT